MEKICGECKWYKCHREIHDVTYQEMIRWECDNEDSENYSFMMDYTDGCSEWEQ